MPIYFNLLVCNPLLIFFGRSGAFFVEMTALRIKITPLDGTVQVKKLVSAWHRTEDPLQSTYPHIRLLDRNSIELFWNLPSGS